MYALTFYFIQHLSVYQYLPSILLQLYYISASPRPSLSPAFLLSPLSSVIMTFKAFLLLLHDGEAIWQWHSASLRVNLTGEYLWETQCEAFPDEKLAGEETRATFLIQRNVKALVWERPRAGWCDDACGSVAYECMSFVGTGNEGRMIEPFKSRLCDEIKKKKRSLLDYSTWQQHSLLKKMGFLTFYCNSSQSVLYVTPKFNTEDRTGHDSLVYIITSVARLDNPL